MHDKLLIQLFSKISKKGFQERRKHTVWPDKSQKYRLSDLIWSDLITRLFKFRLSDFFPQDITKKFLKIWPKEIFIKNPVKISKLPPVECVNNRIKIVLWNYALVLTTILKINLSYFFYFWQEVVTRIIFSLLKVP